MLTLFSVLHVLLYRHTFLASLDHKTGDQHNYVGYVLTADEISRLYTRVITQVSRWGRVGFNGRLISRLRTTQASPSVSLYNTIAAVVRCGRNMKSVTEESYPHVSRRRTTAFARSELRKEKGSVEKRGDHYCWTASTTRCRPGCWGRVVSGGEENEKKDTSAA